MEIWTKEEVIDKLNELWHESIGIGFGNLIDGIRAYLDSIPALYVEMTSSPLVIEHILKRKEGATLIADELEARLVYYCDIPFISDVDPSWNDDDDDDVEKVERWCLYLRDVPIAMDSGEWDIAYDVFG